MDPRKIDAYGRSLTGTMVAGRMWPAGRTLFTNSQGTRQKINEENSKPMNIGDAYHGLASPNSVRLTAVDISLLYLKTRRIYRGKRRKWKNGSGRKNKRRSPGITQAKLA